MTTNLDLNGALNYWIRSKQWLSSSWRNLFLILRLLHQDELAQMMETYLSGEQKRLRDDRIIFQLKQQIATQQQRIADLEYELKGQPS